MKLNQNEFSMLVKAVSLAPSNLIARDRITLIEKAFSENIREQESFLRTIEFDGSSITYSTLALERLADYGTISDGQEALFPYLSVIANDFNLSKSFQIPHKENVDNFLEKYR